MFEINAMEDAYKMKKLKTRPVVTRVARHGKN